MATARNRIWKHKKKFKGQLFIGNYEYSKKKQKRVFKLKNIKTGRETKEFSSPIVAQREGGFEPIT